MKSVSLPTLCSQRSVICWFTACLTIVLSPQMSCVQTWRSNLIGLSPTAPVMVLKRFQVCAKCCFLSDGDTHCWRHEPTTKSALYFFKAFPTLPYFALFTLRETKRCVLFICKDFDLGFCSQCPLFFTIWLESESWFYPWLRKFSFIRCHVLFSHFKKTQHTSKNKMLSDLKC